MPSQIILASTSPRRHQLMGEAGIAFLVQTVPVIEHHDEFLPLDELTRQNAALKARSVAALHPAALVIGADTLVSVEGRALGKPANLDEAAGMLRSLAGRSHEVATAVCLVRGASRRAVQFEVITKVIFRSLSEREILHYLALIDPLDKAGGYAAQDHGDLIIDRIEGSLSNVVGLPMERLQVELRLFEQALATAAPA